MNYEKMTPEELRMLADQLEQAKNSKETALRTQLRETIQQRVNLKMLENQLRAELNDLTVTSGAASATPITKELVKSRVVYNGSGTVNMTKTYRNVFKVVPKSSIGCKLVRQYVRELGLPVIALGRNSKKYTNAV